MTADRDTNRARWPEFAAAVDRFRGSIIAAFVYDPVSGEMLAGTAPADWEFDPWTYEQMELLPEVAVAPVVYRGARRK